METLEEICIKQEEQIEEQARMIKRLLEELTQYREVEKGEKEFVCDS